ncbi:MAG: beta-ketoacyl-ACP synthase I, partial [Pseudomonadota bacterium]
DHAPISSTKSMTGHSLGAAGVHEAIYSLIMMDKGFIAPSINIKTLDPAIRAEEIVTETTEAELDTVLSNSFGFGGTNATVAMSKYHG